MCCFTMCKSRLDGGGGGEGGGGIFTKEKERGKCRMIKQTGEIKNKFIYNDKNAYLSIPLLMMNTRCMNLCRERKKKWGKDDENETEKKSCLSKAAKAKWTTSTNSFKIMHTCLFLSL